MSCHDAYHHVGVSNVRGVLCVGEIVDFFPASLDLFAWRRSALVIPLAHRGGDTYSSRSECLVRLEDGTLGTLPTQLSIPSSSCLEQLSTFLSRVVAKVSDERDDHLGGEVLKHLRRHDSLGHLRCSDWGNGVGVNVVL